MLKMNKKYYGKYFSKKYVNVCDIKIVYWDTVIMITMYFCTNYLALLALDAAGILCAIQGEA